MRIILRLFMGSLGFCAVIIGTMFFLFGAQFTAEFFSFIPGLFVESEQITGFDNADIDGEFRFYSVFWIAYGCILLHAARHLDKMLNWVPLLAGLFFMGGIGRVLSIVQYGEPHLLFQILLAIELVLPVVIMGLWLSIRRAI